MVKMDRIGRYSSCAPQAHGHAQVARAASKPRFCGMLKKRTTTPAKRSLSKARHTEDPRRPFIRRLPPRKQGVSSTPSFGGQTVR